MGLSAATLLYVLAYHAYPRPKGPPRLQERLRDVWCRAAHSPPASAAMNRCSWSIRSPRLTWLPPARG